VAVIALFAKPPTVGNAKTRLAPLVGEVQAAALAGCFLRDSWASLHRLEGVEPWISSTSTSPADFSLSPPPRLFDQGGGDLGDRIERTLRAALGQADRALAVGADAPDLGERRLTEALQALDTADAVLIPATDGGFVALGLTTCAPGLFRGIPWSSPDTAACTLMRLRTAGMRVTVLPAWQDVDEPAELRALAARLVEAPEAAPETARHLRQHPLPARISVIVPVLDEAARIDPTLGALCANTAIDEVIVVDGGSTDDTRERAGVYPVTLLEAQLGRARQLNAGAGAASGEILWFVHADVRVPEQGAASVRHALREPSVVAGAFVTWTVNDGPPRPWSALLHAADVRSRVTRLPYGDQALFVRRDAFTSVGGYPDQPILEDIALARRLREVGRIARISDAVTVSGRRFMRRPVRTMLAWNTLPVLYRLGVSPRHLARLYGKVR
jgi:rSAM/selenodomain-associated transferase 2/rSAM/selenodomain-associated transferase 1